MAISFVGTPGTGATTTTTLSPTWGTGQARTAGNALAALVVVTASGAAPTVSTPAGWSADANNIAQHNSTNYVWAGIFTLKAAGGDAAPSFTLSSGASAEVVLLEATGVDATSPFASFVAATVDTTASATLSGSALTTATNGEVVVSLFGNRAGAAATLTWGGGMTSLTAATFSSPTLIGSASQTVATAGTVVTPTCGHTQGQVSLLMSMSLKPAAAGSFPVQTVGFFAA